VIAWSDPSSEILLNPRMPDADAAAVRRAVAAVPLVGHVWIATSGSTGRLKPVALAKDAILASADAVNRHLASDARDVWLNVLPTFHVGGLGIHARAHLSGARVATLDAWDAATFGAQLTAHEVTLTSLVPTHVFDLVRAGVRPPPSLRAIVVGGGALAPDLYRRARALDWLLLPSYGATECASQIATASLASLEDDASPALELLSHVTARTEAEGYLAIRSPALFTGYATETGLDDPKQAGWWRTDDRGAVEGRVLTVHGRADDTIKVGGELVSLAALEGRLAEMLPTLAPHADAALFAAPDERLGRVVGLAIADADPETVLRIQDAFNAQVLPFERIRATRQVAAIPRTALGKVVRGKLAGTEGR